MAIQKKESWIEFQKKADSLLIEGISKLMNGKKKSYLSVTEEIPGNYLIWNEEPVYIGEANNIAKRISQQFSEDISTFFKTYSQRKGSINISEFNVTTIPTTFGRKEIEEMGIVNLKTHLNKFQLNKRQSYDLKYQWKNWDSVQDHSKKNILDGEDFILSLPLKKWSMDRLPSLPGIYVLYDPKGKIIYIGESSNLKERLNTHNKTTYFSALRRAVASILLGFSLIEAHGKKNRGVTEKQDVEITNFLKTCTFKNTEIRIGRLEIEEFMIKKHQPILNKKSK